MRMPFGPRVRLQTAASASVRRLSTAAEIRSAPGSLAQPPPSPSPPPRALPSLPIIGSIPWFSKLPLENGQTVELFKKPWDGFPYLRRQAGPVYAIGVPGLGRGRHAELIVCSDPGEYVKVLQQEGKFPFGGIQLSWPFAAAAQRLGFKSIGFFGRGADWQRVRHTIQKELLPPAAARRYLPGITAAAARAAVCAPAYVDAMDTFTSRAALDMFSSILLGKESHCVNPDKAEEKDLAFARSTIAMMELVSPMLHSLSDRLAYEIGLPTARARTFFSDFELCAQHCTQVAMELIRRRDAGEHLSPAELNSYLLQTLANMGSKQVEQRLYDEVLEIIQLTLTAAVDTTAQLMNWALINLARNPLAQARLRSELDEELDGGPMREQAALPYLQAVLRESHRLTPAVMTVPVKDVSSDVQLCGRTVSGGSIVMFDSRSVQMDPEIVDDPTAFRPERWLPEAVEARAGSPAAVMDHKLLEAPFSSGARMCPGARVAMHELRCLVAAMVQSYHIQLAEPEMRVEHSQETIIKPWPMPRFVLRPVEGRDAAGRRVQAAK